MRSKMPERHINTAPTPKSNRRRQEFVCRVVEVYFTPKVHVREESSRKDLRDGTNFKQRPLVWCRGTILFKASVAIGVILTFIDHAHGEPHVFFSFDEGQGKCLYLFG